MASQRQLFEELGMLEERAEEANPYETLGIDAGFAQNLLKEDPSGSTLQLVTGGMYRILSRQYHPDAGKDGDAERFHPIKTAHENIVNATPTELRRWSKVERVASSIRLDKMREESNARVNDASELVRLNMELGHDPRHFSQLRWTQGVLVHHNRATLMLRTNSQGIEMLRGQRYAENQINQSAGSFHNFMRRSDYFGIERGARTATYIDEEGRATLLQSDLSFIMDITAPVQHFVNRRSYSANPEANLWARSAHPVLITTTFPEGKARTDEETQFVTFSEKNRSAKAASELPLEVAGSIADPNFYRRIRHRASVGLLALKGTGAQQTHFNVIPVSVQEMIDQKAGYSPLILPTTSLALYDPQHRMPVATDVRILGMLGNGPQNA
jgi:hypothetical protein